MKGINFVVDEHGKRQAAVIDLNEWGEEWEDFYDGLISSIRMMEQPRVKWEDMEKENEADRRKAG